MAEPVVPPSPLLVMGAGAWGTALALCFARTGRRVYLWGRDPDRMQAMARSYENSRYLPGIKLPRSVLPISDLGALPTTVMTAILATPLQTTREMLQLALAHGMQQFVGTAKGIETGTGMLGHEILLAVSPAFAQIALLSGPSFAREVAEGRPTALSVATRHTEFGRALVAGLYGPTLRPYLTDDLVGVAVGGAVKNVLAIAAGIADGMSLGANSRAALITRGLAEMARFGEALGGRPETFMGLAGLGDLILTCTDDQSRNRRFGLALGRGSSPALAERQIGVVEGISTAAAVGERATACRVEMPICTQVARTLRGDCTPAEALCALMARELPTGS